MWLQLREYGRVGEALHEAREQRGLTQADVAARLGKPQSFVSTYERGQRRVDILEFVTIVAAVGADPIKVFTQILQSGPLPKARRSKK
jgi:transcriptional regulator with XRE-family HTH domain